MSWAKIKYLSFTQQCADRKCVDDVGFLAFAYYGQLATEMQKLNSSNTQSLTNANATFDPLFKGKVAESLQRKHVNAQTAAIKLAPFMAIRTKRIEHYDAALDVARRKLAQLGIRNPDSVIKGSRLIKLRIKLVAQRQLQ